jgi:hypothetical protein
VRYLLWELFVKNEVPKEQLESKPVALAIVQRLSRSKGKDSLVLSDANGNGTVYRLNPDYMEDFQNLLSKDLAPEKPKPKPKENKPPRGAVVSTSTGEAISAKVTLTSNKKRSRAGRKKSKAGVESELDLPLTEETDLKFWFEFVRRINAGAGIDLTIVSNGESAALRIP